MELDDSTEQDLKALAAVTGQDENEILRQAVEKYMEETGKSLIRQQGQQAMMQQAQTEQEEEE